MRMIALYQVADFIGLIAPFITLIAFLVSVEVYLDWKISSFHWPSELVLAIASFFAVIACSIRAYLHIDGARWKRGIYWLIAYLWLLPTFLSIARLLD